MDVVWLNHGVIKRKSIYDFDILRKFDSTKKQKRIILNFNKP